MRAIKELEWQALPEQAQREVYDFFLFIRQRCAQDNQVSEADVSDIIAYSNHSAGTIEHWLDNEEDDIWK